MKPMLFLYPAVVGAPSGGHRYNQRIIAQAKRRRFPLQPVGVPDDDGPARHLPVAGPAPRAGLRLLDSLLMPLFPGGAWPGADTDAWLMHYLPSLNPRLSAAAVAQARALEDRIAAASGLFLTTGQGLADLLRRRYPWSRVWVCEPGVDPVFARVGRDRTSAARIRPRLELLTVANLTAAKGYEELLAVLRAQAQVAWRWHVVGSATVDSAFAARFAANAADLVATGRLVCHGPLPPGRLAMLMGQTDLYVSASHFESYGMALAEAVAAGLKVVTTAVGEASRIAGGAGCCVPVGQWGAFTRCVGDAMTELARQPAARSVPAVRGRTWPECFEAFAAALRAIQTRRAGEPCV